MSVSQYNIELLGWLPIKDRLKASLERAFTAAAKANQATVEIEHLLAAFLEDIDANVYFAKRGIEPEELRKFCINRIGMPAMRELVDASTHANAKTQDEIEKIDTSSQEAIGFSPAPYNNGAGSAPPQNAYPQDAYNGYENQSQNYTATLNSNRTAGSNNFSYNAYTRDSWSNPSASPSSLHRHTAYAGAPASSTRSSSSFAPALPASSAQQMASVTVHPKPSPALRRVMAQASDFAERDGLDLIDSETAIKAIAVDAETSSGIFLRSYLKAKEIGSASIGHQAAKERDAERAAAREALDQALLKAKINKSAPDQSAFDNVIKHAEKVLQLLQQELQKDMRYRLANDLSDFLTSRDTNALVTHDSAHLGRAAHPILRMAEAELRTNPSFQAHEQLHNTLQAFNMIKTTLNERLVRLQKVYDEGTPIIEAINKLIELQPVVETHTNSYYADQHEDTVATALSSDHEVSADTAADKAYAAVQEQLHQNYYKESFLMVKEAAQSDCNKESGTKDPEDEFTSDNSKDGKNAYWHWLLGWRKKSADTQPTHLESSSPPVSTQVRSVEAADLPSYNSANTHHDEDLNNPPTGASARNDGLKSETDNPADQRNVLWRNSSRPTLLHTVVITFTLITGVVIAFTAKNIL
ncbi:MAG: hypothetical protein AAFR90_02335 [Pseudomonadota bacterium]